MVLYVATKNQGKIKEINKIMERADIICKSFPDMEDVEETGNTFEENAKIKADFLSSKLKDEYVIADDSGLSVDALNGAPGIYSARYSGTHGDDKANNIKILKEMQEKKDRKCRFICAIALSKNGKTVKTFHGELEGEVGYEERGENGFGYDSIFLLPNGKTRKRGWPPPARSLSARTPTPAPTARWGRFPPAWVPPTWPPGWPRGLPGSRCPPPSG